MWEQRNAYISKELILSLSPSELVYCVTYAPCGGRSYYRGYYQQVNDTGLSETTLRRVKKSLMEKGLLRRMTDDGWQLKLPRGSIFTMIPAAGILALRDEPTALKIYAYLLLCSGRLRCAYPSFRKMAQDTGLSLNALCTHIPLLEARGLIDKHRRFYKKTKAMRSNCYFICTDEEAIRRRLEALRKAKTGKRVRKRKAAGAIRHPLSLSVPATDAGHSRAIFRPPK